jgi:hypothetical protein
METSVHVQAYNGIALALFLYIYIFNINLKSNKNLQFILWVRTHYSLTDRKRLNSVAVGYYFVLYCCEYIEKFYKRCNSSVP